MDKVTIYKQDAIDAIRQLPNAGVHWFIPAEAVFKVLSEMPPAQPQPHWTFMKEKPPKEEGRYLVWMPLAPPKNRITVAEYVDGYWNIKTPVLAWMPVPQFDRQQEAEAQIVVKNIDLREMMKQWKQ